MRRILLTAPAVLLLVACAAPELTPDQKMALRQAQTRSFEVPYNTVFAATMTYLQDNEYQIRQAAKDAGLISAHKAKDLSGAEKFWGAFFAGYQAKKGDSYEVSFTFDQIDDANTKVRVNITHGTFNMAGANTDVQAVTDPTLYKTVMDALSLEVQRKNLTTQMRQEKAVTASSMPK
jgi:hypothetical protein